MRVDVELRAAAMDLPSSSEKAVPSCALCFRLLHKPNERRVLHSTSTFNVWRVLRQLTEDIFSGNVDKFFPIEAYLCKVPCVRTVETLVKLRESLSIKEKDLRDKGVGAGERRGLSLISNGGTEGSFCTR